MAKVCKLNMPVKEIIVAAMITGNIKVRSPEYVLQKISLVYYLLIQPQLHSRHNSKGNMKNEDSKGLILTTPRSRVLPEKLTGPQLLEKCPAFMESKQSLQHSQAHTTCSYPEPEQSSPCLPIPLPENPF